MYTSPVPSRRALEFGIYRDGDNNLDDSQETVVDQARQVSQSDRSIEFTVADTTSQSGRLRTQSYRLDDGASRDMHNGRAADMADPGTLARFVATTLDNAQRAGAQQTWIDLVDHGAGDGGGLEADSTHHLMAMPAMAEAIALGEAMHAHEHPEDANRRIDGVVANQCLMA